MQGFKEFLLRGNLVDLAVAFVIGAAFGTVVESFTKMFMDILGKLGGTPDFSGWNPGGISVGPFLTALIAFVIMAAVIYFGVITPYNKLKGLLEKKEDEVPAAASSEELLTEIRDLLAAKNN
ncbi:MAG: large conductance mechanosensitive channel protein MscL [Tessaracoccus sp.]|uniref:large conductance mechanosensitive channel protein MscL n=1 Tax=Tessaracoccus sp. TaxID=1971211 RepID=UPI001ED7BD1C|nr:large conductance mechanosensitive channel protein MscL [Tessaracoccus sp.]MBK7819828.1 large conductance mechanosensitive channel protein MscL [Tessaracoccus sp.]